jgi:hypothetical protein
MQQSGHMKNFELWLGSPAVLRLTGRSETLERSWECEICQVETPGTRNMTLETRCCQQYVVLARKLNQPLYNRLLELEKETST